MKRNIRPQIKSEIVMINFLPQTVNSSGFLIAVIFREKLNLSKNSAIMKSGDTRPKTYISVYRPPQKIEPGKTAKAKTPAKTGAQQVVAMPEKIPKTKTESVLCFLSSGLT